MSKAGKIAAEIIFPREGQKVFTVHLKVLPTSPYSRFVEGFLRMGDLSNFISM